MARDKVPAAMDAGLLISLRWGVKERYETMREVMARLDDAWLAREIEARLGKPPGSGDGVTYHYTRRSTTRPTDEAVPRLYTRENKQKVYHVATAAPDELHRCTRCGADHPVILELNRWGGHIDSSRLVMICKAGGTTSVDALEPGTAWVEDEMRGFLARGKIVLDGSRGAFVLLTSIDDWLADHERIVGTLMPRPPGTGADAPGP